jgi:hypothetical protein
MPFDALNGSLVEQCPIHVAGFKLGTHPRIRKRGQNHQKGCDLVVTSLTGDKHRSDRCQHNKSIWVGDPTPMTGQPGVVQIFKKKGDLASKVMRD